MIPPIYNSRYMLQDGSGDKLHGVMQEGYYRKLVSGAEILILLGERTSFE